MRWQIRFLIVIFCVTSVLWMNRGHILTTIYGYPYGISRVDRVSNGIPEIDWNWNRYPTQKKKSATQVWINPNSSEPHYAKRILMYRDYLSIGFEEDRYRVRAINDLQLDLVVRWKPKNDGFVRASWLEKVPRIDTNESSYKWFDKREILLSINDEEIVKVLNEVKSGTFDHSNILGLSTEELARQISMIVARYEVIDGSIERNINYCIDEARAFKEMNQFDCSFSIGKIEYNIREKYVFDSKGETIEYWDYKSEGPIVYKSEDFRGDTKLASYVSFVAFPVRLFDNKYIWYKDSIAIDYILQDQKLIFMEVQRGNDRPNRRIIYEYM